MNRKKVSSITLGLALAVLLAACNRDAGKTPTVTKPSTGEPQGAAPEKEKKVELKVVKHADLVKEIEAHKGKVVLVDFWATWCPPCREKFPKVVELHETYQEKGLVCIAVSFDDPEDKDKALNFLKKQNALFPNYLVEDREASQEHWDFIPIPTYLVFSKDGKLAQRFTVDTEAKKPFTMEDIQKLIENELQ